jgi:hypothetical protein
MRVIRRARDRGHALHAARDEHEREAAAEDARVHILLRAAVDVVEEEGEHLRAAKRVKKMEGTGAARLYSAHPVVGEHVGGEEDERRVELAEVLVRVGAVGQRRPQHRIDPRIELAEDGVAACVDSAGARARLLEGPLHEIMPLCPPAWRAAMMEARLACWRSRATVRARMHACSARILSSFGQVS